ncbi:MAG: DUF1850 domain-containing protein [Mesorhizobium sp.]|nr:DUF1850 domain-containing protein [Mesorhizobium sp.]MBN9241729.1 DUF1850 domain-containing protein [Mesorhizobium sp.]
MSICLLAGGKVTVFAAAAFTLSWTHSVEKTRWEEHWQVTPAGLQVVEARVRGSGAGMDPPEGSVFRDGWWIYRPGVGPQEKLVLAASGATGEGWTFCAQGRCTMVGAGPADPAVVTACQGHG